MRLSEFSLVNLVKEICGDAGHTPYMRGYDIVHFFNKFGFNEVYNADFPSRKKYVEDKLRDLNGTDSIRLIIEEVVDPRKYYNLSITPDVAVEKINEILRFDNFELKKDGIFYKVFDLAGQIIQVEKVKEINHQFINEQINKCHNKINENDY
jgi:hypothetical protein